MLAKAAVHQPVEDARRVVREIAGSYRRFRMDSFSISFDDILSRLCHGETVGCAVLFENPSDDRAGAGARTVFPIGNQ